MKICLCTNIYYNVGVAETAYQYSLAAKRLGIDFVVSGFIEEKAAKQLPLVGPMMEWDKLGDVTWDGEEYPLDKKQISGIDLFVFYFDNGNFYDQDEVPGSLERILSIIPRERTIIVDADGKYNLTMNYAGDSNHISLRAGQNWHHSFDSLSDAVYQPTFSPIDPKVKSFLFWGYKEPENIGEEKFDVLYLGSNWYRMNQIKRFLSHFSGIRSLFPKISVWGKNWTKADKYWQQATKPDLTFFEERDIDIREYMTEFGEFTQILSGSDFSPILIRPILSHMGIITPRMLETFASGTIPILTEDFWYAEQLYGPLSKELFLGSDPEGRLLDMRNNRPYYQKIVNLIRRELRDEHSYEKRIKDMVRLII